MKRFLSTWLGFLVIAVFALAMLVAALLLTRSAERAASADLNALLDAAFAQFDSVGADAEAVATVSENNVLAKARAVARFLAHDDALLQTDALVTMCELLAVSAIDVTDYTGLVVASSVAGRIGRNLVSERGTAWTSEVLDGESVERTRVDDTDQALLWGCVPRTDTEGFVLVQSLDAAILTAYASTEPELVLREFSFINDALEIVAAPASDGAYIADGQYCVQRTQSVSGEQGELTLLASRRLGSVYMLRNAVLFVLSVVALISLICALTIQMFLLRRSRSRSHIAFKRRPRLPANLAEGDSLPEAGETLLLKQMDASAPEHGGAAEASLTPDAGESAADASGLKPDAPETSAPLPPAPIRAIRSFFNRQARGPHQKIFEIVTIEPGGDDAPSFDQAGSGVPASGMAERAAQPGRHAPEKKRRRASGQDAQDAAGNAVSDRPGGSDAGNAPEQSPRGKKRAAPAAKTAAQPSGGGNRRSPERERLKPVRPEPKDNPRADRQPARRHSGYSGQSEQTESRFDKIFD